MKRGHAVVVVSMAILLLGAVAVGQDAAVDISILPIAATVCSTFTSSSTPGFVPLVITNPCTIQNSVMSQSGTTVTVNGGLAVKGTLNLPQVGTATSTSGKNSRNLDMHASSFSSTLATPITQNWRVMAETQGNNTPSPSSSLNVLFSTGSAALVETGISFRPNGTFNAKTINGTNISANAIAANGLAVSGAASVGSLTSGGSVTGGSASFASLNVTGAASVGGNLASGGIVSGAAGSFTGNLASGGTVSGAAGSFTGNVASGGTVSGAAGSFTGNVGVGGSVGIATSPAVHLDVGAGAISIDDLSGGLWFKTQNSGSTSNHHMLIAANIRADRQESISIYHCNLNAPADNVHGSICPLGIFGFVPPGEAFRFQWDGNAFGTSWNTSGIDVAEKYPNFAPNLAAGDVVMLDTTTPELRLTASTAPYQENVLGVVSDKPGVVLGGSGEKLEEAKGIPVALNGRVPVKVTLENGPIHAGDYLTSSSRPGYAMRAAKSGRVIGIALTSFGSDSDAASAGGKVIVFVNAHHWENGEEMRQLRAEIESLKGELASRDQQVRELRSEFTQFREALGVQKAALVH